METIIIICAASIFAASAAALTGVSIWIKRKYLEYCRRAEKMDELERKRDQQVENILEILRNFDLFFGNGRPGTISFNVRIKAEFILSLIDGMALEERIPEYKRLHDMLYETWNRADKDPNDVMAIISPLNNLCQDVSRRRIETIRKILEENQK